MLVYLDDVTVFSNNVDYHIQYFVEILTNLRVREEGKTLELTRVTSSRKTLNTLGAW